MDSEHSSQPYSETYGTIPCENCGQSCQPEAGRIPVCNTCREAYIKYPIPKKLTIVLIVTLCIIALLMYYRFPASVNAGILYERANQAMEDKRFIDAEKLLEQAYAFVPNSSSITGNLAVCCHMNLHHARETELLTEMYEKNMDYPNQKVVDIVNQLNVLYDIPEEYIQNYEQINAMDEDELLTTLQEYVQSFPDCTYIKMQLASLLYEKEQYDASEELMRQALQKLPGYIPCETYFAARDREKGNFEASEKKLMELLEQNRQSTYVLSSLSRLELKKFNDEKALEYMETAFALEPDEINVLVDLARSYHYNHMEQERDKLMETILNHPEAASYQAEIQEVRDIIQGTVQWR